MRISLRRCPPTSALFLDYLDNWERVRPFYGQSYAIESVARFAREQRPLEPAHRRQLCDVLSQQQTKWQGHQRGVEKLSAGAVAVVTGQQPVLFSGPLLCILKAISAVKIAADLEQSGIPAVPVFWVASEDHDFEEISSTWILNRNSELSRCSVDLSAGAPTPAGWMELKDDVRTAVEDCLTSLPQSEFIPELRAALQSSYRPGSSPVDAFARMMVVLFKHTDLTLIDPLDDRLKAIAQPTIEAAILKNSEVRSSLMERNKALINAGYHAQVKVDANFTGFFEYKGRERVALRPDELKPGIAWSPNVLLRPVVQDTLLPTVTYIGGPAEIAYFAQAAAVYTTLGKPMPPISPRISATLIEPRVARMIEKYGVDLEDVLRGRDHLRRKLVSATEDDRAFERVNEVIGQQMDSLLPLLNAADETLGGALETSRQKVAHQMESLRTKYVNAVARRNELIERHLDTLCNSLFPEKKLQERVINVTSFTSRYGPALIPRLMENLTADSREHQAVML